MHLDTMPGGAVRRPVKDLKGFARVQLEPGETRRVELTLPIERLAFYDEGQARWIVEPITYRVYVGPSSRTDDLLTAQFRVCGYNSTSQQQAAPAPGSAMLCR